MASPYEIIASIVSICALCISVYSIRQSKRSELNAAYFAQMTNSYSAYLGSISKFVMDGGLQARDDLAVRLYQLKLFATPEIMRQAQVLYQVLLDWKPQGSSRGFPYDEKIHDLAEAMRHHLDSFRYRTETKWSWGNRRPHA